MATYKCKDCSHEEISTFCPIECEICGGSRVVLLEAFKATKKVEKVEDQRLFWVWSFHCWQNSNKLHQ